MDDFWSNAMCFLSLLPLRHFNNLQYMLTFRYIITLIIDISDLGVHSLFARGLQVGSISFEIGHTCKTIQSYRYSKCMCMSYSGVKLTFLEVKCKLRKTAPVSISYFHTEIVCFFLHFSLRILHVFSILS